MSSFYPIDVACVLLEERAEAADAGYAFLHGYFALAASAAAQKRPNYKLRVKWHVYQHTLEQLDRGCRLNPRLWSCWMDDLGSN